VAPIVIRPAATLIEWELIKGADFDLVLEVLDKAEQAVDITGWTGKAQIRRSEDEPVLAEWNTADGTAEVDGTELVLHVDGAITSAWEWTNAQIAVEVYEPPVGGRARAHPIAVGTIRARQEITQ
jgi:hypothetical protein